MRHRHREHHPSVPRGAAALAARTAPSHRFQSARISADPWWRARTIRGLGTHCASLTARPPIGPATGLSPSGFPPRLFSPPAAARKLAPKSGRYLSWLSSVRNCVWVRDRRPLRTDICIAYPPFRLTSRKSSREFGCALHCTAEREWTVRTALLTLTLALPLPRLRSRRARRLREDSTSQGGMLGLSGPLREAPHARGDMRALTRTGLLVVCDDPGSRLAAS